MRLTNEICESFLTGSGWLKNHDKRIKDMAVDTFTSMLIPKLSDAMHTNEIESVTNLINETAEQLKRGGNDD